MTDKERFLNEVKEVKLIIQANRAQGAFSEGYLIGQESVLEHFEKFIDSMQEESEDDWKYSIAERLGVSKDEFDKMKPVSEDLENAAFDYAETCKYEGGEKLLCSEHFKAGAQWHKQQMMKEAVDRVVFYDDWGNLVVKVPKGLKMNDKVKVIIIKED